MKLIFEISDVEEKALLSDIVDLQKYFYFSVQKKIRHCVDTIIKEATDKQPKKMSIQEKLQIIKDMDIETAAERTKRLEIEVIEEARNRNREDKEII